ncbi:MAG: helix-turn-helix transcriptional regulator [Lachnospiraceae bacterium]|nr:helix-turn-helix transcriptional regulator [Lachnospiraceae bacterium]
MASEQRKVYNYYHENSFLFRLGYVKHWKASQPLELHDHGNMFEFVYIERGAQTYCMAGRDYIVSHDEIFFTRPYELHDTGSYLEEVSALYYLIIDFSLLPVLNIFATAEEYAYINKFFLQKEDRVFKASPKLSHAFKRLLNCFGESDRHVDTHIRNALSEVLIGLSTPLPSVQPSHVLSINKSLQYIHEHLEEDIYVAALAEMQGMSVSTYNKYFVQTTGIPPAEYVLKQKIESAKELLAFTSLSVTEIAHKYSFHSSQYFSTAFKRICMITPSQFRKCFSKIILER